MSEFQPNPRHHVRLRRLCWVVLPVVILGWLTSCLLMVSETELVIVERFGQMTAIYDRPEDRGLQFKWPWPIESARRFDSRIQLLDPPGRELLTRDRKNVTVSVWVCWRIADDSRPQVATDAPANSSRPVVNFYRSLGSTNIANARLESRLRSIVSAEVGQLNLTDLLQDSSDDSHAMEADNVNASHWELISQRLQQSLTGSPSEDRSLHAEWGIEIVDAGIRRISFPQGNRRAVYERMKSERLKIAEEYRASGAAEAEVIAATAQRGATTILAKADAEADRIRSQADAEALTLLNAAHARDPELFEFLRTLEAYGEILGPQATVVLSTSSKLFRVLTDGVPQARIPANTDPAAAADGDQP